MKSKLLIFSFLFSLCFFSVDAQKFEGVVILKNSATEGINATFTVKGDKVLMEAKTEEGVVKMLSDAKTGIFYTLIDKDSEKMAIKNDRNSPMMKMAMDRIKSSTNTNDDVNIQVTTETKTINGYKCVKVIGSSQDGEGYAWVAKDLKLNFEDLFPMKISKKSMTKRMEDVLGEEGFIMELYNKDKNTGEEFTMNAMVIEKSVDISESTILEGYEIWDMTDMMKIMQEAQKNPKKMEQLKEVMKEWGGN